MALSLNDLHAGRRHERKQQRNDLAGQPGEVVCVWSKR